jgi:ribonuclease HI
MWQLKAYGYMYMGPMVTNNWCEYNALKDGLAQCRRILQKYDICLEVYGDSQMIVAVHNGVATIKQPALRQINQRVQQLCGQFAWMTWKHTKREHNKMTDFLANETMNARSSKVLTEHTSGLDTPFWATVEAHLANDIRANPSAMRQTPLSSVLSRIRHS